MSNVFTKEASAAAAVWSAPDMGGPSPAERPPTVSGLADLQDEAYREAFDQGLEEGREAGRGEARALVERLAGMFHDLAKPCLLYTSPSPRD